MCVFFFYFLFFFFFFYSFVRSPVCLFLFFVTVMQLVSNFRSELFSAELQRQLASRLLYGNFNLESYVCRSCRADASSPLPSEKLRSCSGFGAIAGWQFEGSRCVAHLRAPARDSEFSIPNSVAWTDLALFRRDCPSFDDWRTLWRAPSLFSRLYILNFRSIRSVLSKQVRAFFVYFVNLFYLIYWYFLNIFCFVNVQCM